MAISMDQRRQNRAVSREDTLCVILGLGVLSGIYADGWAHVSVGGLDTFFTPWHLLLYSTFAALSAWVVAITWRRRKSQPIRRTGYAGGLLGIGIFALGGFLDMLWHVAFGIETGIDALVSPTHLLLLTGGVLLLSSPSRSDEELGGKKAGWLSVMSLATVAGLAAFFLSYSSVFVEPGATSPLTKIPEGMPGHALAEVPAAAGLAGYLLTTALLVIPVLMLRTRGPLLPGTMTVVTAMVAIPGSALSEFRQLVPALVATLSVAALDLLFSAWRWPTAVGAATMAVAAMGGQMAGLVVVGDLRWPASLWVGSVILSAMFGFVLSLLSKAVRPRAHALP